MAEEPRKRSRFDQPESEPRRTSRFDRSRSPVNNTSSSRRSRSPVDRREDTQSPAVQDAAARAAAAAARIKAGLEAKGRSASNPAVPVRPSSASHGPGTPSTSDAKSPPPGIGRSNEIYQQDGDYIRDIDVNSLKNRYTLTKGATQKMIKEQTGADVTTRGEYYPDTSMATAAKPPLYLHITSQSKEGLEKAVALIEELIARELPNLVDERRLRRRDPEPQAEREERFGRRPGEFFGAKIPIDLEPIPGFNLRAQVVGKGGEYVKFIQSESGCKVQIKGRGSGYMEGATNAESDEPMYLHVTSNRTQDQVDHGQTLAEQLVENVREQYRNFKANGRSGGHGGGHNRDYNRNDSYGNQGGGYGGYSGGYGGQSSPAPPPPAGSPPASDYSQAYAQYYQQYADAAASTANNGEDVYAAYGGYENYQRMMYQYYYGGGYAAQAQQEGGDQGQAAAPPPSGSAGSPPPPPPGAAPPGVDSAAPPPPPPGAAPSGYSNVPPPPGL